MAGQVFVLFCIQAAVGVLALLPFVDIDVVGRSFYKINGRVGLALLLLGYGVELPMRGLSGFTGVELVGLGAGVSAALGAAIWLRTLDSRAFKERLWMLKGVIALAVVGLLARLVTVTLTGEGAWRLMTPPAILAGAILNGSVTLAMILGHYYLNHPKLSIDPLRTYSLAFLGSAGARTLLFLIGFGLLWQNPPAAVDPDRGFFLENTLVLIQRGLFGVVGPMVLAVMTWETVKIQSTQSATGILYAAMVMVAVGELTAGWFLLGSGIAF